MDQPTDADRPFAGVRGPAQNRARVTRIALIALALLAGVGLVYAGDLGGLRSTVEERLPGLASLPFIGSGRVYATALDYAIVEGGADIEASLALSFSGPIDPATASGRNVKLLGLDNSPVNAEITVTPAGRTLAVRPLEVLAYETDYQIVIRAGLHDLAGEPIFLNPRAESPGATFGFRTRNAPPDTEPPALAGSTPAADARGVAVDEVITLTFSEPMAAATVNGQNIKLLDSEGNDLKAALLLSTDFTRAQLEPQSALKRGARYTVQLSSSITDASGNPLPEETITFHTVAPGAPAPARLSVRVQSQEAMELVRFELDGKNMGSVPKLNISIAAGRQHTLRIIAQAPFSSHTLLVYEESFSPSGGQKVDINAKVRPFGTVNLAAEPPADVFIDGKFVGVTPLAGYPLLAGEHRMELHPTTDVEGYAAHKGSFTLDPFERKSLGLITLRQR